MTQTLLQADPEIHALIEQEHARQNNSLGLIASENHVSPAVLEALGSCLTDKYAEGYPGRRWYFGCEQVDVVEHLPGGTPLPAVEAEEGQAAGRVAAVVGLDHVVLFFREKTMLGREQAGEPAREAAVDEVPAVAEAAVR